MRVAGIDLGTNTFLCLIADVDKKTGKITRVLRDEVRIVRLGEGVQSTKVLAPQALKRAEAALTEFSLYIEEAGCDRVLAVATSAARDAKNGQELLAIGRALKIPIEIISGEREAELTFAGAIDPSWKGRVGIIDVGGGSTELIVGSIEGIEGRASADVGSVRLTEKFITAHPIAKSEMETVRQYVHSSIQKALESLRSQCQFDDVDQIVAVAGTPTTLAAVDLGHAFESDRVHGHRFTLSGLENWIERLARLTVVERQALAGMEPKRADVIVAGALCLTEGLRAMASLQVGHRSDRSDLVELKVSVRGLRYGVAEWAAARQE